MTAIIKKIEDVDIITQTGRSYLNRFGLNDWQLRVVRSKRKVGLCVHSDKRIDISVYQVDGCFIDTLLHEIAHALTPGSGHGLQWQRKCLELGCRPTACFQARLDVGLGFTYQCHQCSRFLFRTPGRLRKPWMYQSRCCKSAIQFTEEAICS